MQRDYSREEVLDIIECGAIRHGIPPDAFLRFAYIETGGRFDERASRGAHGAKGLFQFVPGTARHYGIAGQELDPEVNTDAAARLYLDNQHALIGGSRRTGLPYLSGESTPAGLDMYLAHQQGVAGYVSIQRAIADGEFSRRDTRALLLNNVSGRDMQAITGMTRSQFADLPDREIASTFVRYWGHKFDRVRIPEKGIESRFHDLGQAQDLGTHALQKNLNTLGFPDAQGRALAVDGHYGPSTRQAIESFQHRYAMPVTGKADVMTVAAVQASVQTLESLRGIDRFGQQYGGVPGIEPDWRGVPYGSHPRTPAYTPAHQPPTERVAAQPPSPPSPKAAPPHSELPADMVRTLQDDLNALGVCDGRGQPLQVDGHYGRHTAAAVAAFQREQGLPATGVADNRTLGVVRAHVVVDALQQRDAERAHAPAPTFDARAIALPDSPIDATPTAVSRDSATVHAAQHPGLAGPDALRATYGMSPAMPAAMPPPQRAADQPDYMHGLSRAPTPHARADAASPDALAMLRAQVHQMEEQMAAMVRQRDTERDPQRAGWDAPSRPGADEPAPHTGSRMNYSDPRHPQHALYTDAKARLEGQGQHLPEDRLTQVVGMLHRHGFQPGWDGFLTVREDKVFGRDYSPWGGFFDVGLKEVAPSVQDTLQQVDAHQQSVVQDLAQREQQSQSHGRGRSM